MHVAQLLFLNCEAVQKTILSGWRLRLLFSRILDLVRACAKSPTFILYSLFCYILYFERSSASLVDILC